MFFRADFFIYYFFIYGFTNSPKYVRITRLIIKQHIKVKTSFYYIVEIANLYQ